MYQLMIALAFSILDILSGSIKAIANKSFTSKGLRIGGLHKLAIFIVEIAVLLVDKSGLLSFKLWQIVYSYIVIMELISIYENVKSVVPGFKINALEQLESDQKEGENENGN